MKAFTGQDGDGRRANLLTVTAMYTASLARQEAHLGDV